ncbi:MAG: hypothetical protein EOR04_26035 [Mesorhizobium sp.]|uniref:hypothetical protein n=1 Tax=Mesorhizobium sp. TaxID=1871066 RepID=UPI000FE53408|nr:hypothetical protein [Mesorhizobium sp.]RWP38541.1 MAG: hypothetical protein EOR04_26035 [Mesorhizobium sp.]
MYADHDTAATFDPVVAYLASRNNNVTETTDQFTPAARWQTMVGRRWAEILIPSTAVSWNRETTETPAAAETPEAADAAWFAKTLARFSDIRKAAAIADSASQQGRLEAVEYLIAHFAAWPADRRPDLTSDETGAPHFSAKGRNYYLHLSIEDDAVLNWYAVLNGRELSQDEDRSFRNSLSEKLVSLSRK